MGHGQSVSNSSSRNVSVASESGLSLSGRQKFGREHKRHGVVTLKMVSTNPTGRRGNEQIISHTITPKGCILYPAGMYAPATVQHAIATSGYPILAPTAIPLADPRAHKILVTYCRGWHIIPFPEVFSRHSGTCLILGDRQNTSPPFQMKVGDCFRLGSVGLVVSEMRADGEEEQRIDGKTLEFLKDEALAFDTNGDLATLAADEERMGGEGCQLQEEEQEGCEEIQDGCQTPSRACSIDSAADTPLNFESPQSCQRNCNHKNNTTIGSGGIAPGERFVCYMCYETHDTEEDALVAPCDCRGDTRYLHVQCLQKWYQASITGVQTQVIRTTGNGAPACKICGSAYKTAFRRADGRKASLLEMESNGPYLSLVVVTKHDTNPGLFNTKFRLNFHSRQDAANMPFPENLEDNIITIGRSSSCNMILDYRTVSTIHARITYEDGKFYLTDRRSSNGTMVYLQDPFPLPYQHSLKLRMGRTTLSLQAKRNWTSSLRTMFGASLPQTDASCPSPEEMQSILASCTAPLGEEYEYDGMAHTVKEDTLTNEEEQHRQEVDLRAYLQASAQGGGHVIGGGIGGGMAIPERSADWVGGGYPSSAASLLSGERDGLHTDSPSFPRQHSPFPSSFPYAMEDDRLDTRANSYLSRASGMTGYSGPGLSPGDGVASHSSDGDLQRMQRQRSRFTPEEEEALARQMDEDVNRAIELSLAELARQELEEERAAAQLKGTLKPSAQAEEAATSAMSSAGIEDRKPSSRTHSPAQGASRPQSGAHLSSGKVSRSPSKALFDYSQPELVCDSADEAPVSAPQLKVGGGAAHQSSLITVQQLEGVGELNSSNSSSVRLSNGQQTSTWEQQQQQEELSTTLPIAGAFTPFSHSRRSNQNFQQQQQLLLQETEGSSSSPVKGYLSKENSFTAREAGSSGGNSSVSKDVVKLSRENSCSGSAGDKERDGIAAVDSSAHLEQDEQAQHTLQRNRTDVDLDTAPSP